MENDVLPARTANWRSADLPARHRLADCGLPVAFANAADGHDPGDAIHFRLLHIDRVHRVPDALAANLCGIGALVALEGRSDDTADDIASDGGALAILFISAGGCAGAVITADQADALAKTLRDMAADVRAEAFSAATDLLRRAARD